MKKLYGDRFIFVKGSSVTNLQKKENLQGFTCDLFSIDGDHYNLYKDLVLGRNVSRPGAYVLADDYASVAQTIVKDWNMGINEKWLQVLDCHKDEIIVSKRNLNYMGEDAAGTIDTYPKGWCFGQYIHDGPYYMYKDSPRKILSYKLTP